MSNKINKQMFNPYNMDKCEDKSVEIKPEELNVTGFIKSSLTGEFGNRQAYLQTGYYGHDGSNYFVASEEELRNIIDSLEYILENILTDKTAKRMEDELLDELYRYIDNGYVKSIKLTRMKLSVPGFSSALYIPFKVEPEFNYDLPDDNINLGFNFLRMFRFPIKEEEYQEELKKITNSKDISIHFVGFDRKQQIRDFIKDAKDSLKDYDPSKNLPPTREQVSKVLNIFSDLK